MRQISIYCQVVRSGPRLVGAARTAPPPGRATLGREALSPCARPGARAVPRARSYLDDLPAFRAQALEPLDILGVGARVLCSLVLDDHLVLRVDHVDAAEKTPPRIVDVDVQLWFGEAGQHECESCGPFARRPRVLADQIECAAERSHARPTAELDGSAQLGDRSERGSIGIAPAVARAVHSDQVVAGRHEIGERQGAQRCEGICRGQKAQTFLVRDLRPVRSEAVGDDPSDARARRGAITPR